MLKLEKTWIGFWLSWNKEDLWSRSDILWVAFSIAFRGLVQTCKALYGLWWLMTELHLKNTKFKQPQKLYLCKQCPEAAPHMRASIVPSSTSSPTWAPFDIWIKLTGLDHYHDTCLLGVICASHTYPALTGRFMNRHTEIHFKRKNKNKQNMKTNNIA